MLLRVSAGALFFYSVKGMGMFPRRRGVSFCAWLGMNAYEHCKWGITLIYGIS